ncbi:MAG: molybdenum ABC transporter ATP-binding protein [Planctomycetota bacterium]
MSTELTQVRVRLPLAHFVLDVDIASSARSLGVFGPSGAGKTSFIEALAGWRRPEAGRIRVGETVLFDESAGISLPIEQRGVGYVPQDALLLPHWTVGENVRAGGSRGGSASADESLLERTVAILEIAHLLERPCGRLSGGERQRVALARALVSRPRFLLLDEPLGSLDLPLRRRILPYLIRVRAAFDLPMVVVSHDATEIQALCEEVVVLERGRVVASGPAQRVLRERAQSGYENVLTGRVHEVRSGTARIEIAPEVEVQVPSGNLREGERAVFALGADEILVSLAPLDGISARNRLSAVVEELADAEGALIARTAIGDGGKDDPRICVGLTRASADELGLERGRRVHLVFKTQSCRVLS